MSLPDPAMQPLVMGSTSFTSASPQNITVKPLSSAAVVVSLSKATSSRRGGCLDSSRPRGFVPTTTRCRTPTLISVDELLAESRVARDRMSRWASPRWQHRHEFDPPDFSRDRLREAGTAEGAEETGCREDITSGAFRCVQ